MTTKAIAFTPATVKERKDDPFDKEILLAKSGDFSQRGVY